MNAIVSYYTRSARPLWPLLAVLSAIAFALQWNSYVSTDNGWLLYAAGRYLNGETLYRDLLETNPPLVIWLYALPVSLAAWLGIGSIAAFIMCVLALLWVCVTLVYDELKKHPLFSASAHAHTIIFFMALTLFLCASLAFGQREHLWMALIAPYLIQSLALSKEPPLSPRQIIIAALAAIGFALKPFFVIVWIANEVFLACSARHPMWLLRRTNLIIGVMGVAYVVFVAWQYPAYFSFVLPMLMATYGAYEAPFSAVLKPTLMLSVFYVLPALLVKTMPEWRKVTWQLVALYAAVCSVQLIQQKGWYNHYYPMMFMGTLLASVSLVRLLTPWIAERKAPGRLPFILLYMSAIMLVVVPFFEPVRLWKTRGTDHAIETLKDAIHMYASGRNVVAFSFSLDAAFPLVNYADARYPSRFHHLWMVPGLVEKKANPEFERYVLASVGGEFKKYLPALVWVDNNDGTSGVLHGFDFIAFFSQDAEFKNQWKHYRQLMVVNEPPENKAQVAQPTSYTVYIRR